MNSFTQTEHFLSSNSSESVITALNNLLAKSAKKLKNEKLEEQFKEDLINKQLKAFDDLWQYLELTESLVELRTKLQEKSKANAHVQRRVPSADNVFEQVQPKRIAALKFRMTTLEEKVKEQQNALRVTHLQLDKYKSELTIFLHNLAQVLFDDVEQKRGYFDSVSKRREKLVDVIKAKDIEMNVGLDQSKERRISTFRNDRME